MNTSVKLERSYAAWVAPVDLLVELADLAAFHASRARGSAAEGAELLTGEPVQVRATWTRCRSGVTTAREAVGTPAEVAGLLADSRPQYVRFEMFGSGATRWRLGLAWSSYRGCTLSISGDAEWASASVAAFDHALRPYVRWWAWLHSLPRTMTLATVAWTLAVAAVVVLPEDSAQSAPLVIAPWLLAAIAAVPMTFASTWLPAFEFVGEHPPRSIGLAKAVVVLWLVPVVALVGLLARTSGVA